MNFNCIFSGVGGQGIVLASKLIAQAALNNDLNVKTAETIGMAHRGGSVVSHVRIGDRIYSPLVPKRQADTIISFEPGEAVRCIDYLKPDGTVITSDNAVKPVTDNLLKAPAYKGADMIEYLRKNVKNLIIINPDEIYKVSGSNKTLNTALIGAASMAGVIPFKLEEIEIALKKLVKDIFIEVNIKALHAGANAAERR